MSTLAPTDIYFGPTALVMWVPANTGRKGISQNVAVADNEHYVGSMWVKPDRDADFRVESIPETGATTIEDYTLTANEWNLVTVEWATTTVGYGSVEFTTDSVGLFSLSCPQFCRKIDLYDPEEHIIPNGWSRGGLGDSSNSSVTIERFDDVAPYEWSEVLAETSGDVQSWAKKTLVGGALTYSLRDLYFPLSTDLYYRARIDNETVGVSSPESGAAPVSAITDNRWLLIPSLPGRTGEVTSGDVLQVQVMNESFESESESNAGVHFALGRSKAIVISDTTVTGEGGPLELAFRDKQSYAVFEKIRKAQCPILLRSGRYEWHYWIRIIGTRKVSTFLGTGVARPIVTFDWVEVDPPENVS